jgi:hypothetical protein
MSRVVSLPNGRVFMIGGQEDEDGKKVISQNMEIVNNSSTNEPEFKPWAPMN